MCISVSPAAAHVCVQGCVCLRSNWVFRAVCGKRGILSSSCQMSPIKRAGFILIWSIKHANKQQKHGHITLKLHFHSKLFGFIQTLLAFNLKRSMISCNHILFKKRLQNECVTLQKILNFPQKQLLENQ